MIVNVQKLLAMFWSGLGAILLIQMGYIEAGGILLGTLVGFAVGEQNGAKTERKKLLTALEDASSSNGNEVV